jgi:hypothetical protein
VQSLPFLDVLEVDADVTDAALTALGVNCPFLNTLHCYLDTGNVTDVGITNLAQGCPKLRGLSTRLVAPATVAGITALATHCRRLHVVHAAKLEGIQFSNNEFYVRKLRVFVG